MQATRPPPMIIHKEYTGKQPPLLDDTNGNGEPPLFSDEQIDMIAQALADLRVEFQSTIDDAVGPLTEQVAVLQGQLNVLLSLIGSLVNNNNNSNSVKEASETKIKTVRRVRQIESKPR